jgi:hypothetical protein
MTQIKAQNIIVALTGVAIILLGLNVGLGGIRTLGWQGTRAFVTITDAPAFWVQDSHIRFVGGVWFGVGVTFLIGAARLDQLRPTLTILSALIAAAGLFRLSALRSDIILSADIAPSLILELVGFPLLALWLHRSGAKSAVPAPN